MDDKKNPLDGDTDWVVTDSMLVPLGARSIFGVGGLWRLDALVAPMGAGAGGSDGTSPMPSRFQRWRAGLPQHLDVEPFVESIYGQWQATTEYEVGDGDPTETYVGTATDGGLLAFFVSQEVYSASQTLSGLARATFLRENCLNRPIAIDPSGFATRGLPGVLDTTSRREFFATNFGRGYHFPGPTSGKCASAFGALVLLSSQNPPEGDPEPPPLVGKWLVKWGWRVSVDGGFRPGCRTVPG